MKTWIKDKMQSEYMQRQFHMMSSLGLFYIILIALFAVPLMGTFVVVIIKGVLDFQYLILAGGIVASGLAIYYTAKFFFSVFRKIREDGGAALREAQERARQGQAVQIGLMGGLLTISCGGPDKSLSGNREPLLLPDMQHVKEPSVSPADPLRQIRELSDMKKEGIIDADEFQALKTRLIGDICNAPSAPPGC
ncbi:MAG: SHOCT domain-containing protein [Desulfococcaceae bacterium]